MVEGFNRTLREVISRLMDHSNSNRYVGVLDELLDGYTNTLHSRHDEVPAKIGMEIMWRDCGYISLKGKPLRRCNRLLKLETMFTRLDQVGCLLADTMRGGQRGVCGDQS